ncbi:MAG TPA: AI-2E family transporter [Candidatus Saccharimonadales bacterium]|nr:AI-2E family transporter [Candidatus Saccharimonadales bacterium]
MKTEYTISWRTIFRLIIAGVSIFLIWKLASIILMIIVAMMLASAFHPFVTRLEKFMPATLASILVMVAMFIPIVLIFLAFIPNLISQFPEIVALLGKVLNNSIFLPEPLRSLDLTNYAQNIASYLLKSTPAVTSFLTRFVTIIFLSLYFLIDSRRLLRLFTGLVPDKREKKLLEIVDTLGAINGHYIRGNLLISVICGTVIFFGLFALRIPFAGPLALFAAVMDLLPLIGAVIGIIPAAIIGFALSPTIGFLVVALFLVYQQLENNVIAPNVYNRALSISPALSFIAVIVGGALFGMIGAFISLPIAASIPTVVAYLKGNPWEE